MLNDALFRNARQGEASDQATTINDDDPDEDDFKRRLEEIMRAPSPVESVMQQELVGHCFCLSVEC